MRKQVRRALLTACGIVFFIGAPIVVLYAVGYRFISTKEEAVPVGVLLVESVPRGATIYVNNEKIGRSPRAVPGLPEGNVTVRLEKQGYASWEKQLPILPTKATEARTIKLFAENPQVTTLAENVQMFNLSPNRRLISFLDDKKQLHIVNTQNEALQDPIPLTYTPTQILWSPDSSTLLLEYQNSYQLITLGAEVSPIPLPALTGVQSVAWDPRLPGRLLGITAKGNLVSYSTASHTEQVLAKEVRQFVPTTRHVIAVTNANKLVWYSLQGNAEREQMFEDDIAKLLATPSGLVAVQLKNGAVRVVTANQETLKVADSGASPIGWSPDGTILLLQSGSSELAVFNVENERATHVPLQQLQTIIRLSRPIRHAQWFAGGTHVVFQVDDEVVISEVDTRDHPIQFTADSTNTGNAQVAVGEDGNTLLYLKLIDGLSTLVRRPLVLDADQ